MVNAYSMDDLLDFLDHAGERGLMPVTTARALAVATRNVLGVLTEDERRNLAELDVSSVIRRFNNKRAKDLNPSSRKEYGRRVQRALGLYREWREDPANFTVNTRATSATRRKNRSQASSEAVESAGAGDFGFQLPQGASGYQSSIPVRPGVVVTLVNVPLDLTKAEAERLASFVRMLAVDA